MDGIEPILALHPTLVIGSVPYKQETVAKLLEQPINFLAMNPRTLSDIEADVRLLGRIAGRETEANRLVTKMRREFAAVRRNAKAATTPRVYCEAWPNPRISSPPWVSELVEAAGGRMVLPAGERVSDAQVAEARPDIIILAWAATGDQADPEQAYKIDAWQDLPAVRNRRVHVISDELLNTPGPPLVDGVKVLSDLLMRDAERSGTRARRGCSPQ